MSARQDLAGATARGMAWSMAATAGGRIISLVALAILARLLAPEDFGLLAFALVFIAYLETVGDLGTGMALIYWPDRWRDVAQLTLLANLVMGFLWLGIAWGSAPWVADFFGSPEGEPILRALAWVLPLKALGTTHDALLQRELRFRARAVPELALMGGKAAVAVPLAVAGFGAWSLVWGQLVGQALWTGLVWVLVSWRPERRFPRDLVGPVLEYGRGIVSVNVLAAVVHHADVVVVGRMLGAVALGFYQMAYRVPDIAITLLVRITSKVLFPALSRLKSAGEGLRDLYLGALRYLSLLTIPGSIGLVVLAEPLVVTLFGEEWRPSAPIMQALAAYTGLRALGSYAGDLLKATGRPSLLALLGVARAVVLVPALIWAGARGTVAVALALLTVTTLSTAVNFVVAARLARASAGAIAEALRPAVLASIPMLVLLLAWTTLARPLPAWAVLVGGILVGMAVYGAALRVVEPAVFRRILRVVRRRGAVDGGDGGPGAPDAGAPDMWAPGADAPGAAPGPAAPGTAEPQPAAYERGLP
ncbi:MAG TPA: lipopolysaccharide biosynthesis protein [Longimicrobiales bacterium]|nr:lipopolysaccharide biosynthesis protein [Longimicrobiales bacterium]